MAMFDAAVFECVTESWIGHVLAPERASLDDVLSAAENAGGEKLIHGARLHRAVWVCGVKDGCVCLTFGD